MAEQQQAQSAEPVFRVDISEAYLEACTALGEAIVRERLMNKAISQMNLPTIDAEAAALLADADKDAPGPKEGANVNGNGNGNRGEPT